MDIVAKRYLWKTIHRYSQGGSKLVVLTTHSMEE